MRSPFPGMDPYLEQHWGDVHSRLIVYAAGQLQRQLPGDLRARIEERLFVESDEVKRLGGKSDVRVVEYPHAGRVRRAHSESSAAVAEPLVISIDDDVTETYINIIEVTGERVVTSIEFLSPSNKLPGEGRDKFLSKRKTMQAAHVNIVEIDLTRSGDKNLLVGEYVIPESHRATYQACVWRGVRPSQVEIYAFPLQEVLPAIRIPLRAEDRDVHLNLQRLIDQCYEEGAFDTIDYSVPPEPRLAGRDATWVKDFIKKTKKQAGRKNGLRRHR